MRFGNRRIGKPASRRRSLEFIRVRGEELEDRTLLSIDLGGTSPTNSTLIAAAPYGMDFAGTNTLAGAAATTAQGAGWSVADLGDVTDNGYDDFLIGAPTVSNPQSLGNGVGSAAFLVFGSQTVGQSAITQWIGTTSTGALQYTADDRVGDLGQLGNATQTNPITTTTLGFPFAGVTFTTSAASNLGASASTVVIGSNYGILIGAPGGDDANGANPGTGRAYFITGNIQNFIGKTINLDTPTAYSGITIYTFVSTATGSNLGRSVAGGYNIFGDSLGDIMIGAPLATVGTSGATGAVYALSTALLSGTTSTINVTTIGQSGSQSAIFVGAASGSEAGWSVADGGDVNGVTSGGKDVDDLLIGSPSYSGGGAAYLIYGGNTLAGLAQTYTVNSSTVRYIDLSLIGAASGTTGAVPGATILGPSGSETGWAVSAGGDFNDDGFGDFLVGSPDYSTGSTTTDEGLATLFYGAASTSAAYLTGDITLSSPPTGVSPLYLTGATAGALAGYSVAQVGTINASEPSLILIGSPGYDSDSGTAYLLPGVSGGLSGTESLLDASSAPLDGLQFLLTTPGAPSTSPAFFGASVSSFYPTSTLTSDGDAKEDFIIGAPGYDALATTAGALAGGAMIIEGGLITVPIPTPTVITTTIGVNTPTAPFSINATTPTNLQIYVFGIVTSTGTFEPVTDIDPTTITVNGIAFANATLTPDPNKADWVNGIQDAIITISPRSSLNLKNGTQTITIAGKTLTSSPFAGEAWTGSASVSVTGSSSGGGGGGGLTAAAAGGPVLETTYNSSFGATQYTPTISALSTYNYAPIPLSVAMAEYEPTTAFADRIYSYNHDGKQLYNYLRIRGTQATGLYMHKQPRLFVDNKILDRSRFHAGKTYTYTHKAPKTKSVFTGVVPTQDTTQSVSVTGAPSKGDRQVGAATISTASFNTSNLVRGGSSNGV